MDFSSVLNLDTPCQELKVDYFAKRNINFFMKRDDMMHPFISGNKWRKLKFNIEEANRLEKTTLLTFGGAFSNHLIATACAAASLGFKSIGIVRGNELNPSSNFILKLAYNFGMQLIFVDRKSYKNKVSLEKEYSTDNTFVIPQGGDNDLGIKGCREICDNCPTVNHVIVCSGTGTTAIGISKSLKTDQHLHIIDAVGYDNSILPKIESYLSKKEFTFYSDFANGGFGKYDTELMQLSRNFTKETGVLLDPVYTSKMIKASYALVAQGVIKKNESVLCIHTGGLTGVLSKKWLET